MCIIEGALHDPIRMGFGKLLQVAAMIDND